jgi:hypothetical protein
MVGSTVWLLWPEPGWRAEGEPAVALVAATATWIFLEVRGPHQDATSAKVATVLADRKPHPSDLKLVARLDRTVTLDDRNFLREHDFRRQVDSEYLRGIGVIAEGWNGADYEFHDEALQVALRNLVKHSAQLVEMMAIRLFVDDRNPRILTPLTDLDRAGGVSADTLKGIEEMNGQKEEVLRAMDHLNRLIKERLSVALSE